MQFNFIIISVLSCLLIYLFAIYCWNKLERINLDWKNPKMYIAWIIMVVIGTIINMYIPKYLKIFFVVAMVFLVDYFLVIRRFDKSISGVIIFEMLSMVCELIMALVVMLFAHGDTDLVQNNFWCVSIISLGVPLLMFLSMKVKIPYTIYNYLIKTFNNVRKNHLLTYFIAIIFLASILMVLTYMNLPSGVVLFCNTILIICFVIIVVRLINAHDRYKQISNKFETSITSLREYEDIMNKYRVATHENKNQLLTIRNMLKDKDKKTVNYIDKIIDNKIKDNYQIFDKTLKIPEGGLRAIIYSKICKMNELKINYCLNISNDLKTLDIININEEIILSICTILGVFFDNAIEEVQKLSKKNIIIELFVIDKILYIEVSNNYQSNIDFDKLGSKGYTTKGNHHGYGLSLVNEIVKINKNIENNRTISPDYFTQQLKIKL